MKTKPAAITFLLILVFCSVVKSQILKDSGTFDLMRKGVDQIYNMDFESAREVYQKISVSYPNHPMTSVFKGMITYWESYPLLPESPGKESFEKDMTRAIKLAEKPPKNYDEAEYLLANIGARGLLLLFYADNDMNGDVISVASGTYQYVKQSFHFTKSYADFYFITGLYNYYREAYPQAHPVYKPVALLFPKGNKAKGLQDLKIASKNAIVLKAEAYSFLSGIYISFENNFEMAYQYSKALHELYPKNVQYMAMYIKNLLLVKRYDEAESLIKTIPLKYKNAYLLAQAQILQGIVLEKKYKNLKQAQQFYIKGIKDIQPYLPFGNEFCSYAYYGLSRIASTNHDTQNKKTYRKKAEDLGDFKNVNFDK